MAGAALRWPAHTRAVVLAAAFGGAVTVISVLPLTSVAYRSSTLHVAIETAAMFAALLGGTLVLGRFARHRARADLVIAMALLLLGFTNLCFAVVPWVVDERPGSFDTWTPIAGRLLGAAGLAVGSLLATTPVRDPRRAAIRAGAALVATLAMIGLLGWLLAPELPVAVDPDLPPDPSGPDLVGEPALLVTQVASLLLYTLAAIGFTRRASRTGDELMTWFAAAATLAAFSRLNYFLFPSLYSEWVYAGDFLRLAFYALMLAGALREIVAYQPELAAAAVFRERRRIARDLHDGLAQDLSFIRFEARRLRGTNVDDPAARIAVAAERALDESRAAIAALARPMDAELDSSIARAAEEVAGRAGVRLDLDLAPRLGAPEAVHETLTRIVREGVTNAIRHGEAEAVVVRLAQRDGLRLTIEDDGPGLPGVEPDAGFGLTSMRERAEALGGSCRIFNRAGGGVCVEVWLP